MDSLELLQEVYNEQGEGHAYAQLLEEYLAEEGKVKVILCNAFSNQMLGTDATVKFSSMDIKMVRWVLSHGFQCAIGHADTARIVGDQLGLNVQPNRISITMDNDTELVIAQYIGPRLPEGATELPEGAQIRYIMAKLVPDEEL